MSSSVPMMLVLITWPHSSGLWSRKEMAQAVTGVGNENIHGPVGDLRKQLPHALLSREVGFDLRHLDAQILERRTGLDERRVGRDDQIVTVLRCKLRDLEADPAGGSGDDCELTRAH